MTEIDFEVPSWLITCYHVLGFISIFLNSLGIYLLLWENGKIGFYKYYLLSFQVFCTMVDIHLTFLMQPVPLYPLLAGYSVGILATVFNVSLHYSFTMAVLFGFWELSSLTICFAKKHQSIARILQKRRAAPTWLEGMAYILFVVFSLGVVIWPQYLKVPKDQQLYYIEQKYPEYLSQIKLLSHFDIYEESLSMKLCMLVILLGGIGIFFLFLLFIIDIFILMNELKVKIAASTFQKHQEAVKSLMVQLATSVLCLGPPCIFVIVVLGNVGHQQFISEILLCWFATHSSINVICLIMFFPPYRRFFLRMLRMGRKRTAIVAVHSVVS